MGQKQKKKAGINGDDAGGDGCTTVEYSTEQKRQLYKVSTEDLNDMTDSSALNDLLAKFVRD
ncbi:hypothetical protein ACFQE1_03660 [Halobium palmae]|uniref:Uncharacterized protein n=1 Tax=Halobium palmae TaxID=1776492 RepID=A0ABD5RW79_9EURY